jgi:hypothetical protein
MMARSATELAAVDKSVAERTAATVRGLYGELSDCIARAQEEGSLDADADTEGLASLLLAVLRKLESLGRAGAASEVVIGAAKQALALLPRASPNGRAPDRQKGRSAP